MAGKLDNWHGIARCPTCGWEFDVAGDTTAINVDSKAASHERKFKHGVNSSLHRLDYCKQLGCKKEGGSDAEEG